MYTNFLLDICLPFQYRFLDYFELTINVYNYDSRVSLVDCEFSRKVKRYRRNIEKSRKYFKYNRYNMYKTYGV